MIKKRTVQIEVDYIAALNVKEKEKGSITEQRMEDMQKYIVAPPTK